MKRLLFPALAAALLASAPASAQDWAKARFDKTPRHYEYVKVTHDKRDVTAFITYPEVAKKATAVIVIHENMGLTDWVRSVTDQFAEAGYIAIAPDCLSGMAPNGGGTAEFGPNRDGVSKAFGELSRDKAGQVTADLDAIADYVKKLDACNGKIVVIGFCWGGGQSFRYATNNKDLKAALVSVEADGGRLDCGGVLLMLSRHAYVLDSPNMGVSMGGAGAESAKAASAVSQ